MILTIAIALIRSGAPGLKRACAARVLVPLALVRASVISGAWLQVARAAFDDRRPPYPFPTQKD